MFKHPAAALVGDFRDHAGKGVCSRGGKDLAQQAHDCLIDIGCRQVGSYCHDEDRSRKNAQRQVKAERGSAVEDVVTLDFTIEITKKTLPANAIDHCKLHCAQLVGPPAAAATGSRVLRIA